MITTASIPSDITPFYGPAALLTAFGNSLTSPLLSKIFTIRGIYKIGKGIAYNGVYYDQLKDANSDVSITLLAPQELRLKLRDGEQIEVSVYLSKRFQPSSGRIEIQLLINELLSRQQPQVNESDTRAVALIQQKAKAGFKDADSFIKRRLFEQQPVTVTILIGQSAIIDQDIQHQLKDAAAAFKARFIRINLSSVAEITRTLQAHQETDLLVIARGGGEQLHIFDDPDLAATALTLKPIFLTALGHCTDEPLLQKVADKALITPTALGQYFYDLYTHTLEDLQGSKAKLIKDLSQQIDLNYLQKMQGLQAQIAQSTKLNQAQVEKIQLQSHALANRLATTRRINQILVVALCAALLFVLLFCSRHT
jgi:exodeoxyribonuclease VII large subunit